MKTSRRRSQNVVNMPQTETAGVSAPTTTRLSDDGIAQRAYELYCARGCQDGHDLDDWFQAERELRGGAASSAA